MSKKIAILGASGDIGRLCVEEFTRRGDAVVAVGRRAPKFNNSRVENIAVDYTDETALHELFARVDAVLVTIGIEYATTQWRKFWVPFAEAVVLAVQKSGTRTVFFDNVYSYGLVPGEMTEETPYNPCSKKGEIRKQVDLVFDDAIEAGLPVVVAKAPDFYGPGATKSLLGPRFHEQLAKGNFEWFGDPTLEHTFGYIPDFPPALHALLHADSTGVYHLPVSDEPMSAARVKQLLETYTGETYKYSLIKGPLLQFLALLMSPVRELKEMMYQYEHPYRFASRKILEEFPQLSTTSLEQGVRSQYDAYRSKKIRLDKETE